MTKEPHLPPDGDDLDRVRGFLEAADAQEADTSDPNGPRPEAPPRRGEQNLTMDSYDKRLYEEAREATGRLREMLDAKSAPDTLESLARDLFAAFYKAQPDLVAEESVEERPLRANRPFLETLLEDHKTYETRATTTLDELYSAAAATAATQEYLEQLEDEPALVPPPPPEETDDPSDADPAGDGTGDDEETPPTTPGGPSGRVLRKAARAVAGAAQAEAEDLADALDSWGIEPADLRSVPLAERLELAQRLRGPDLRRLADLVGRMRNLQRASAREKVAAKRDELHSVASGRPDDPARVLPSELSALASKKSRVRRLDFLRRFVEGRVLHYELRRDEKKARGPIVALIDCSGSMAGTRMEWAAAVGLALADMATGKGPSGGRPCALVFFNARIVREVFFEGPDARDPKKLLEAATVGAGGGTEYVAPIARGVEIAGAARAPFSGADLVLVTDGECALPDPFLATFLAEKERLSLSLHSVLIGRQGPLPELARYSDEVHALGPAMQGARDAASSIFERLA